MGHYTTLYGEVKGISEESYDMIRDDLMEAFESVFWRTDNNGTLAINSFGKHYPDFVDSVLDKITFCLDESAYGELTVSDDESDAVIFFTGPSAKRPYGMWIEKPAKRLWPENPFKEHGKDLYGFRLEEKNGEQEYKHDLLVRAGKESDAWDKAQEYAMHWYHDEDVEQIKEHGHIEFNFFGGMIGVRIDQVCKTTKEEWLESQYQSALIDSGGTLS